MPLTCKCDTEIVPGMTVWYAPTDYSTLPGTRRKRCASCETLISPKDTVTAFNRCKIPSTDIEIRMYGEYGEIPRATQYHCEECADLWFSFRELGFKCINPDENVRNLTQEYAELYGPNYSKE